MVFRKKRKVKSTVFHFRVRLEHVSHSLGLEGPITTLSTKSDVKPFTDYASGEAFQLVSFTTKQNYFARYDPEEGITPFCREWVEILTDKKRVNKEFGNDMYRIVIEAIQQVHGEIRLFNQFQLPFNLDFLPEKRESQSRCH